MQPTVALLEPIYDAKLESIRESWVNAMDEVPIKTRQAGPAKMKTTYLGPIYGRLDEIGFTHSQERSGQHVLDTLGLSPPDGACAAQCWLCGLCLLRGIGRADVRAVCHICHVTTVFPHAKHRVGSQIDLHAGFNCCLGFIAPVLNRNLFAFHCIHNPAHF